MKQLPVTLRMTFVKNHKCCDKEYHAPPGKPRIIVLFGTHLNQYKSAITILLFKLMLLVGLFSS